MRTARSLASGLDSRRGSAGRVEFWMLSGLLSAAVVIGHSGCSSHRQQAGREDLVVAAYLSVISMDVPHLREEKSIRFCLATGEGRDPEDPPAPILEKVSEGRADVSAISACDVTWLVYERGPRKDLQHLDVMVWLRRVQTSEDVATVEVVRSGRYGHRQRLRGEFRIAQKGWDLLELKEISIE